MTRCCCFLLLLSASLASFHTSPQAQTLKLAATTTTDHSGLLAWLLPVFQQQSALSVRVIVRGSGAAFALARRGDVDVLLTHDPPRERQFVAQGWGIKRTPVFYNHFLLVGPQQDPAQIRHFFKQPVPQSSRLPYPAFSLAFQRIQQHRTPFLSRGDHSGTHQMERSLWQAQLLKPWRNPSSWYLESGSGMGATLNTAASLNAYTLVDTASWKAFGNKGNLVPFSSSGPQNIYSTIAVAPQKHPHTQSQAAKAWIRWLRSASGKKQLRSFRLQQQQVFFPL